MTEEDIASALRISVPTLVKYFGPEIKAALARRRAEAIQLLAGSARKGNVGAQKEWLKRLEQQQAAHGVRERERPGRTQAQPRMGKKEEQQAAADKVAGTGGKFAPPAAPQLIVDNARTR